MENPVSFFLSFRWQDAVDILLNGYILFRFYVLFRGTNVFRVLVGIALLWFFQRMAVGLGFIVSSWVLQGITAVAAIIIIVVFRNEIRSVLQAKNFKTILWGIPRRAEETPVEIVSESAFELAEKRIGALIVFPGRDDLEELIHSGISWQGLVSREMIMSIFWKDNPVHDGAAIIQGARISQVGAILPISHEKPLPSRYGTRHRAAVGLSENTDALVVVVSEERGQVSIAKGGSLRLMRRKRDLEQEMKKHAGIPTRPLDRKKRETLELGVAALASLTLISVVWFGFTRGQDTYMTLEVPVEYINRDPKTEVLETSANRVTLHLTGSGVLLRALGPGQIQATIDLSQCILGENILPITRENISLPPGVFLRKIEPSTIQITLDSMMVKQVPVQVDWVGELPKDLLLVEAEVDHRMIQIRGPESILRDVSTVYTEKISLENIRKSGTVTVKPVLNPPSLRIPAGGKEKVAVKYRVEERLAE